VGSYNATSDSPPGVPVMTDRSHIESRRGTPLTIDRSYASSPRSQDASEALNGRN
jgi:hypothetical protein